MAAESARQTFVCLLTFGHLDIWQEGKYHTSGSFCLLQKTLTFRLSPQCGREVTHVASDTR